MNDDAVDRTAPATPGLLKKYIYNNHNLAKIKTYILAYSELLYAP